MDLIERYLAAIGRQLPRRQAGDIVAELRDVLLSRVEEQERRLGRPLNGPEVEALLVDFGNPLAVAGRYRRTQHLIGPEVFPYWWAAIKVMLAVMAGVYLVLGLIGVLADASPQDFTRHVPSVVPVAIYLFGLITLGAAAFERFGKVHVLQRWKPSRLPPAIGKRRSPFELGVEIAWNLAFLAWWMGAFRVTDLVHAPYPDFMHVDLAPVWATWSWAVIAFIVTEIAADILALARPDLLATNTAILTVRYLFAMGVLAAIQQSGHYLVVTSNTWTPDVLARVQENFDRGMGIGITVTIIGMGLKIGQDLWRLRRARQFAGRVAVA